MLSTRRRRGLSRGRLAALASVTAAVVAAASAIVAVAPVEAAGICATPGGSGAGGTLTGVVNTYYPGTAGTIAAGATSIPVGAPTGAATPIAAGDLLLVIQMQGADINATNTDSYGDGVAGPPASGYTALGSSGLYEYVLATSGVVAGSVSISGTGAGAGLINSYTQAAATGTTGQRTYQVVRVPQFTTATTSSTLTAAAWNGSTGGVLALDTTGTLTLNGTVSVDGLGFRGGIAIRRGGGTGLANTDVAVSSGAGANGTKGEGVAGTATGVTTSNGYPGGDTGRGAPANAGGGGTDGRPSANDENTGGGGGGNGGAGGLGGNSWNSNVARGGYGGVALPATGARVFLGGGGGAGTGNDFTAPNSSGASGGGIVLMRAGSVAGAGTISANGAAAYNTTANDGGGGGGAGGSIVLTTPSGSLAGATLVANGGRGGNAWATQAGATSAHGPGGGGGGGVILTSSAPTSTSIAAGQNGITTTGNLAYGATPGQTGSTGTVAPGSIPGASGGAECANLSITKTGPASVSAGGTLTYSLAVANAGPAAATAVTVLDTLPAGVTFVSAGGTGWSCTNAGNVSVTCTRPALANGASAPAITVSVTAPAQAGTANNTASVSAATPDPVPSNNTSSTTTTVLASADLSIVKTGPGSVAANATVTYSLAVANAGPSDAASLTVTDTLPVGVTFLSASGTGWSCSNAGNVSVTCTRPALATATSAPAITITVRAPAQGATLTNGATVTSATADPVPGNNSSTVGTTVVASADLAIAKTGTATVAAGGTITYAVGVTNLGPSDAAGITVTDTLPTGVTFVSASGSGWSCSNAGNVTVTCTRSALAATSAAPSIAIVVTAPAQAASLTNTASVASTTSDPNPGNNTATAATTVTASADLAIAKSGPATVVAGSSIAYSLTVRNNGPSDAANVSVTDTLPAGVTFAAAGGGGWSCGNAGNVTVTCTRPALAAGATAPVIAVTVTAPASAAVLSNSASVASSTADPNPANNTAVASTTVTASADVSIAKLGPATVTASGALSYQVDVANAGPSAAVAVSMVDTLPAGVTFVSVTATGWTCSNAGDVSVTCTLPSLASGASAPPITIVVTAPAQPVSLSNTAAVTSTTADPDVSNNSDSVATDVTGSADLAIVKTGPASVVADSAVTYQLAVANNGPSDAVAVSVTDTLPAGVTFVSATGGGWSCTNTGDVSVSCTRPGLAAGTSASVITVVVRAPAQPTTLSNVATVASTTTDPVGGNNTSSVSTAVTASADLAITKSAPAMVVAGDQISYALVVRNIGPSDAVSPTVLDTLPPGVAFVSASGGGWSCSNAGDTSVTCVRTTLAAGATAPTITVVVDAPAQAASLTNNASVSSTTPDPVAGNNAANATTTVTASADLSVTKTAPATIVAGAPLTYTLLVANAGPSDAANVTVTDTLPSGVTFVSAGGGTWSCSNTGNASVTCTRVALAAGASSTITVVVTAPDQGGSITNTAAVASTTSDPDPSNNSDTATTTVTPSADLSITKAGPTTVTASGLVTYTLDVANDGPSDAVDLEMTDTLPGGVTFVSASGTGWACANVGDVSVTCTLPLLAAGDSAATITVVVDAPAQAASLTNTATIASATPDPVSANNSSSTTTTVDASADLRIAKSGPPAVTAAGTVTYQLVVVNDGPSDSVGVSVTDTLPAGVTFVSADGTGWSCANTGDVSVTCTLPVLASLATAATITIVVEAPDQASSLTNTATVTATTPDPDLANNTSSVSTGVTAVADVSLVKTGPASAVAGSDVTYTLAVANGGPSDAAGITVTDQLPAGSTFVAAVGTGWSCSNAGNATVTCTRPSIGSRSAAPDITVTVTAPSQAGTMLNTASVASTTADPDTSNNAASATTAVTASADLSLTKTGPLTVDSGATVTYLLTATNNGPSDAVDVTVTDTLPAGVTFVSADGAGWTCTPNGSASVSCATPALAAGDVAPTITVVVTAPTGSTTLVNRATVDSATPDPDPANDDASVSTQVAGSADLSIVKSGPPNIIAGDSLTYSLVVANAGPDAAIAVEVEDTLPAGVVFVSAAGDGWTCTHQGNVSVVCARPTLATGATAPTITVVVTAPTTTGSIVNTASVASATADPTPDDNSSSAPTVVVPGGGGDDGDNGNGDGGGGDNPDDLPRTGATVVRDATLAVLLLLSGFALVLVSRLPRSRDDLS